MRTGAARHNLTEFDVARHQPHPPGYPVFIALAKAAHAAGASETASLALLSVSAGALGVAYAWRRGALARDKPNPR